MEKYLTISQAADILKVSPETLRRWDNSGKFKSSRHPINNYRVYSEGQLTNLVEELQLEIAYRPQQTVIETISPYFSTAFGELYNINAIRFLQQLETASVDLVFADPPYNIRKAEWDTFSSQKEYVDWSMEWITEAHRVLKRTGSLYVCGFSEILADIKWTASPLFKGCKWLVWFYRNKANLGNDWGRSHESILHFRKSKDFIFNRNRGDYLLFFGRIHHDKGTHEAIRIAKKGGMKLIISGIIQDQKYFDSMVQPYINDKDVFFVGASDPEKRNKLLGNAYALLHPINFDEPFGLSVAESMMCGTPVIAYNRGSMPELIRNGVTGFLVNDIKEATGMLDKIIDIKREDCSIWSREQFSRERMVKEYIKVYDQILKR